MEKNALRNTMLLSTLTLATGMLGYSYVQYYWPLVAHSQETTLPSALPPTLLKVNENEKVDYQFYSMLQDASPTPANNINPISTININPIPTTNIKPLPTINAKAVTDMVALPPKLPPKGRFFLQIASFKTTVDAQRLRQQLQQKGLEARIININLHGGQWHRLVTGHYLTRQEATIAKQRLQHQGLSSIILQSGNGD